MSITPDALRLQAQLQAQINATVDQQTRDLTQAWITAWDEIAPTLIDALEQLFVDSTAGTAIPRALVSRNAALARAAAQIAHELTLLAHHAGVRIVGDAHQVVHAASAAQADIVGAQLPRAHRSMVVSSVPAHTLDAIVRRTTQQITSATRPLAADASDAVRRELIRGIVIGSNPNHTAKRIVARTEREFNGGLARAINIARTETIDAHRAGAQAAQDANSHVLAGWVWLTKLDVRTCPACLGMAGSEHPLTEPGPLGHQQCRCARMPKTKTWAELGINVPEPASTLPDPDRWFDSLSPAEQAKVLGPKRYAAWVAGEFPRDEWAVRQENDGWRDSYVPAKPSDAGSGAGQPPATPPAAPGAGDPLPPMGPVLGTVEQQAYVKDGEKLPLERDERGRIQLPREDNANFFPAYVPDDEGRTTAYLQYFKPAEAIVKALAAGDPIEQHAKAIDDLLLEFHLKAASPHGPAELAGFTREDLTTDLIGAAARLAARQPEPLGTVFRGIGLTGIDPDQDGWLDQVKAAIALSGWTYASATTDDALAMRYAAGDVVVLLRISDAHGIRLQSMGRMSPAPEVLLTGRVLDPTYTQVSPGVVVITGRWQS